MLVYHIVVNLRDDMPHSGISVNYLFDNDIMDKQFDAFHDAESLWLKITPYFSDPTVKSMWFTRNRDGQQPVFVPGGCLEKKALRQNLWVKIGEFNTGVGVDF